MSINLICSILTADRGKEGGQGVVKGAKCYYGMQLVQNLSSSGNITDLERRANAPCRGKKKSSFHSTLVDTMSICAVKSV